MQSCGDLRQVRCALGLPAFRLAEAGAAGRPAAAVSARFTAAATATAVFGRCECAYALVILSVLTRLTRA